MYISLFHLLFTIHFLIESQKTPFWITSYHQIAGGYILTIAMNCSILWVKHRMYKVLCSISQDIDCCSCCCCNLSSRTLMVKNRIELRFSDSVQCCFDSYKLHATSTISGSNQSVKRYISRSSMIPALKSDPWLLLALIELKRVLLLYLRLLTFGGLRFLTLVFTTNYNNV